VLFLSPPVFYIEYRSLLRLFPRDGSIMGALWEHYSEVLSTEIREATEMPRCLYSVWSDYETEMYSNKPRSYILLHMKSGKNDVKITVTN